MRTAATNAALELTITAERLGKYLAASAGNLDRSLSLYERNARLSESFYIPLQAMEVCLRNALNRRLSNRYGMYWYLQGQAPLKEDSFRRVQDAIADLSQANKPVTPGSVIAELGFGFWVGLLGPRYDQDLWRQALFKAFRENGCCPK